MKAGPNMAGPGHHRLKTVGRPLDNFVTLSEAYSFRKLRSAYFGPAVKLRRATGGTQDIGFTAFGDFDTAAAAAFCAATTCFIDTWYDQSGNARHAVQATTANQLSYVATCAGTLPCERNFSAGGSANVTAPGPYTTVTGKGTFSAIARRSGGTDFCIMSRAYSGGFTEFGINAVTDQWHVAGTLFGAATASAFHAGIAVVNGASSVIRIDATETTGTVTGGTGSGSLMLAAAYPNVQCDYTEWAHWDNYIMPAAERAALTDNQKNYWGFP